MRIPYLLGIFLFVSSCTSQLLEEVQQPEEAQTLEYVTLYETVFKEYDSVSVVVDVGGPLGKVRVSLDRDNALSVLSGLSIQFGDSGAVKLDRELLSCIPNPIIEVPMFYYTELGDRTEVPDRWYSAVKVPFPIYEQAVDQCDEEEAPPEAGAMIIPWYPAVEFEFQGFKLNRIRVRKSSEEVRATKAIEQCPADLVSWAYGPAVQAPQVP